MTNYRIEKFEGKYELVSDAPDGSIDVHGKFDTREEAEADLDAGRAAENAEHWYQFQYNYACGYYD